MLEYKIENQKYQKLADEFLASSNILAVLKKYGDVEFSGAYPAKLMMHGDVDIKVARDKVFSQEEIFNIFKDIYFNAEFKSYFIMGDWNDPRLGNEFPNGRYIGLKTKIDNETWKFDIWFVSKVEMERLEKEKPPIANIRLSSGQRETILKFKKHRKDKRLKMTGQQIYDLVLQGAKYIKELESLN
ncbi:MAG: hypothetical protein A3I24_00910 [Candidatus Harrisonbacteria bacterium RIFCSPLOWO2_02_FULL_41_13b]|uniref:Uncharacterized protein n=1 Tax=Candidatus Harrisonbacteria bacterium RIFCSPLOWO2_02_FULL_41_13b TaxID=1798409 RepID=A0A1G1ZS76_9BACT|nr:MAG: hypothetical protein A3I24_00910 [Candidatus Harrisonbacteria bacterium RIFCSPLOWO2_02_FULL_41_13b]OHB17758.1 MAG: hypothetical protein A2734_02780 [Parcubacteria group bacterium RIFCSPHIGHO2_01_FULL_40_30]